MFTANSFKTQTQTFTNTKTIKVIREKQKLVKCIRLQRKNYNRKVFVALFVCFKIASKG